MSKPLAKEFSMDGIVFRRCKALWLALLLGLTGMAQANTIDFDDIDRDWLKPPENYAGFQWDPSWQMGFSDQDDYGRAPVSGHGFLRGGGQSALSVSRDNPFEVDSLWLGGPDNEFGAKRLFVIGYGADDKPLGESGWLRIGDTPVQVTLNWSNVTRLTIRAYGNYLFTMDDLTVRDPVTKVSEGGALALLGIGLLGLWAARRRLRH